jgi:integrase
VTNKPTKRTPRPKKPLPEDMAAFLRFKKAERKSPRTMDEYASLLRRLTKFRTFETHELNGVEGADLLIAFVESLHRKDGTPLDSGTSRKYYSMLGTYTSWLVARGRLDADPAPRLPDIAGKRGRPKPMPELTFHRLLEAAPTESDRLSLLLMGRCGLRRAELRGVRLRDFDLTGPIGTVRIIGKGNKPADQPLLDVVRLQVERVLQERPNLAEYLQYPIRTSNLPGQVGRRYPNPLKPLSENAQDNWWAAILLAADVPPTWTMHQLRHTAGTFFYAHTLDPQQTQFFMRHSKMETTFESYVQGSDEARLRALQAASAAHLGFSAGGHS